MFYICIDMTIIPMSPVSINNFITNCYGPFSDPFMNRNNLSLKNIFLMLWCNSLVEKLVSGKQVDEYYDEDYEEEMGQVSRELVFVCFFFFLIYFILWIRFNKTLRDFDKKKIMSVWRPVTTCSMCLENLFWFFWHWCHIFVTFMTYFKHKEVSGSSIDCFDAHVLTS